MPSGDESRKTGSRLTGTRLTLRPEPVLNFPQFSSWQRRLVRAHQQLPEDPIQIPRSEIELILFLLGPLARLIFDQFARVALKAVDVRRGNVVDAFAWPSTEARSRLEWLPVFGPDLFHPQFIPKLAEVKRRLRLPLLICRNRAPFPSLDLLAPARPAG